MADYFLQLLVASPLHLLLILVFLAIVAFRAPRHAKLRRYRWVFVVLAAWTWLSSAPALAHALLLQLEQAAQAERGPTGDSPALILVLGGGERFDPRNRDELQLNLASLRRTLSAAQLWKRVGGEMLLLGSIRGESVPVAERMARLAQRSGVNADALQSLPASYNTRQNIERLPHEMLADRTIYLVTSAWHMPRAVGVARDLGLDVIPVACDYRGIADLGWRAWLPSSAGWPLMQLALHEYAGLAWYAARGWLVF